MVFLVQCFFVEIIWFLCDSFQNTLSLNLEWICAFLCPLQFISIPLLLCMSLPLYGKLPDSVIHLWIPSTQDRAHKTNAINACLNRNLALSIIWKILTSQLVLEQFDIFICFSLLLLCVRHDLCSGAQIRFKYVVIKSLTPSILCGKQKKHLLNTWHQTEEISRPGLQFCFLQIPLIILPFQPLLKVVCTGIMFGFGLYS